MQHRRLARDIEIVVVDGCDPFAGGVLRDLPSRLKVATLIVVVGPQEDIQQRLAPFSKAPLVGMRKKALTELPPHQKVGLFCGIGRPERFVQTVRDLNQEIVDTLFCKDHTLPSLEVLRLFARGCREKGATALLCTEKDVVKLDATLELPVIPVAIELEIAFGHEHWQQLMETIVKKGTT
jgi:tetraacyldisaccharide 4'-kinase